MEKRKQRKPSWSSSSVVTLLHALWFKEFTKSFKPALNITWSNVHLSFSTHHKSPQCHSLLVLPPPSSLLLPPSTTNGWHHASRSAKFQTCNVDEIMKGLKRRLTVFWAFRYFFLSSFMFINSSLLFRNKKMMSLLTAENRTRCQQGSRRSGVSTSGPKVFFFRPFF